jgi:hypothetical protein
MSPPHMCHLTTRNRLKVLACHLFLFYFYIFLYKVHEMNIYGEVQSDTVGISTVKVVRHISLDHISPLKSILYMKLKSNYNFYKG